MLKNHILKCIVLCFMCLFFTNSIVAQFNIPEKPKKIKDQTSLYDYIGLLSPSQNKNLEQKLIRYSDTTSTQIVVAIINSTNGENINYLGAQWGHKWGIGQAKEDNGVLILLAKNDRKIAINTGYGVEHLLTDAMSKRIIERDIIPFFKKNDYYGGLNRGVDAIFEVLTGEYKGSRKSSKKRVSAKFIFFLIIIFIIILISISKNRRGGNKGNRSGGSGLLEALILSSLGSSSGGFGSSSSGSSGGGFGGGFGGGGFGGGGASGGW